MKTLEGTIMTANITKFLTAAGQGAWHGDTSDHPYVQGDLDADHGTILREAAENRRAQQLVTRERPLNAAFIAQVQTVGVTMYANGHAVGHTKDEDVIRDYIVTFDLTHAKCGPV
jgi:hypothetical protein